MLNALAMQGARVMAGRADNLHVSGHAYQVRCAALRGAVLRYAALRCAVLHCAVLCCTVLCCQ
jgi:hypothetical protein